MNRTWMLVVGLTVVVGLGGVGCGKKQKPATPAPEEVTVPTVESVGEAAPDLGLDETPIWDQELDSMNRYAQEQGLLGDVYFDYDRYELRPEARERLARNAEFMAEHPDFIFTIEGHCDERGTNEYNLALGDRRAATARNYLSSLAVDDTRLSTISYGEERPQCTDSEEACWRLNRRATFLISGRS
ncbi:MAG: peptidoglycan-associated lipoprotein Pal [Thermoanaerobaculia bacterium]